MKLSIKVPLSYPKERAYIIDVLFETFLGLDYQIEIQDRSDTLISLDNVNSIVLPDILFQFPEEKWLSPDSLPKQPLRVWDANCLNIHCILTSSKLPVIYGLTTYVRPASLTQGRFTGTIKLPIDIFGSAFFMLTRYEEIVKSDRDERDRFPALSSLAYQENFLDRPIIDEYVEVLWSVMKSLWPGLERKKNIYQVNLSHDVDSPLYGPFANAISLGKNLVGDIIKRKDWSLAGKRAKSVIDAKLGYHEGDPNNTFDFIMNCSEKHGLRSAFYFMTGGAHEKDAKYDVNMPWIKNLIQKIAIRGHEVGLHTSYETYLDPNATRDEFQTLLHVADECNVRQDAWGGRQHSLRWFAGKTWSNWEESGLNYDSTLSYAQHAGFRCGCCREYPVFDLIQRKPLLLRERPLIIMEGTLFDSEYMGLGYDESADVINKLSHACKIVCGQFSLLWHNSMLIAKREKQFYLEQIDTITI